MKVGATSVHRTSHRWLDLYWNVMMCRPVVIEEILVPANEHHCAIRSFPVRPLKIFYFLIKNSEINFWLILNNLHLRISEYHNDHWSFFEICLLMADHFGFSISFPLIIVAHILSCVIAFCIGSMFSGVSDLLYIVCNLTVVILLMCHKAFSLLRQ